MTQAGAPAPIANDTFDDVVAVGRRGEFLCTGILVAPRAVLTAKHCTPASLVAFGGDVRAPMAMRAVASTHLHPEKDVDLALLLLAQPVGVRGHARRVDTPSDALPAGTVRIVGFGATDVQASHGYGIKRQIDVPVAGWGCDARRSVQTGCSPRTEMVIPRSGGNDTCAGDSGGPVYEWSHAVGWTLVAITSRAIPNTHTACGEGGIYVRADRAGEWLNRELADAR